MLFRSEPYGQPSGYALTGGLGDIYDVTVARASQYGDYAEGVCFFASYLKADEAYWLYDAYGPKFYVSFTTYRIDEAGRRETLLINTQTGEMVNVPAE